MSSSLLAPPGKPSEAWEGVIDRICAHGIDGQNRAGVESSVYKKHDSIPGFTGNFN